jgi:hypothetical protein
VAAFRPEDQFADVYERYAVFVMQVSFSLVKSNHTRMAQMFKPRRNKEHEENLQVSVSKLSFVLFVVCANPRYFDLISRIKS